MSYSNPKRVLSLCVRVCLIISVLGGDEDGERLMNKGLPSKNLALRYTTGVQSIRDSLPEICKHLHIRDLSSAELTCKEFQKAAAGVKKRRGFQIITTEIHEMYPYKTEKSKPIKEILKIKPKAVLFFIDKLSTALGYDSVTDKLIKRYRAELSKDCAISTVLESQVISPAEKVSATQNHALGLFLPNREGIEVRTNDLTVKRNKDNEILTDSEILKNTLQDFLPNNQVFNEPLGLILFNVHDTEKVYSQEIFDHVSEMYKGGHDNLAIWGSRVKIAASSINFPSLPVSSLATAISGTHVRSWSLVIDINDSEQQQRAKILHFKNKIRINEKKALAMSIQILNGAQRQKTAMNRNAIFSTVFPSLRLIVLGGLAGPIYCLDTVPYQGRGELEMKFDQNFMCYLVISWI